MVKIGIIRERKRPADKRVALLPEQCVTLTKKFPEVEVVVESSPVRCIPDQDYRDQGIHVSEDMTACDILLGIKEVPVEYLIARKTYLFFTHTIKKQPQNKAMLKEAMHKNITLIDYECIRNNAGQRVIAFGYFAGIVGAYNAILAWGIKYKLFELKPAHKCAGIDEMFTLMESVLLPHIKIVLTGGGRVAKGAMEVFKALNIKQVDVNRFLNSHQEGPVFVQLNSGDYNQLPQGGYDRDDFHKAPSRYISTFRPFYEHADVLISGAYWDPRAPKLFDLNDIQRSEFNIRFIADITCDIGGSIPTTVRSSTVDAPFYDINRMVQQEEPPFSDKDNITVMAVDNLPCEVPIDASRSFGDQLIKNVFPDLIRNQESSKIQRAIITKNGKLTTHFSYLSDYIA